MMVPMRLGPGLLRPVVALALVATPTLAGCGLFDGGSNVDKALEYLPADTFSVRFTGGDIADDLDTSELGRYAQVMEDAPFNGGDIEWEAWASWGDPGDPDGTAAVWKVDDDPTWRHLPTISRRTATTRTPSTVARSSRSTCRRPRTEPSEVSIPCRSCSTS